MTTATEDVYRTNDGSAYFTFVFVEESDGWRADIQKQPDYGSRDSDLHSTHRLSSSTAASGHKICFASSPRSLAECQKYAEAWSEATWEWIKTGQRINNF